MRSSGAAPRLILFALLALVPGPDRAEAGVVVMRDGRAIRIRGDYVVRDQVVVFQLDDGTHASLRTREVDLGRTRRANEQLGAMGSRCLDERTPAEPVVAREAVPEPAPAPAEKAAPEPRDFEDLDRQKRLLALLHTPTRGPDEGISALRGTLEKEPRSRAGPDEGWEGSERRPYAPLPRRRASVQEPVLEPSLLSPQPGEIAWGATPLVVAVPSEDEARLEGVDFRVDGLEVASLDGPPFEASWEAPGGHGTRSVEAILRWRDGRRERLAARVKAIEVDAAVNVELVPLHVSVSNRERVPVVQLGADEFILFEDGVRQSITHFSRVPVPVSAALVLDLSFSMMGGKLDFGTQAARGLLSRLEPGDRVALLAFDEEVRAVVPFTSDRASLKTELASLESGGGTALFDTALLALDQLAGEDSKRVLILVSDGEDYHSEASLEDVLIRAARLDAIVYAVGISGGRMRGEMPEHWARKLLGPAMPEHWADRLHYRGIKFMRRLAEATGGVLYMPKYEEELSYVFSHILEDLKSQYELGYYSTNRSPEGRWRRVSLYVVSDGYEARTREGYYAQGSASTDLASR